MVFFMKIGQRVKTLRLERGIKSTFVADKIGLSQPLFSMIERDKSRPTVDAVVALADFFGVTTDYLLKGNEEEEKAA